MRKERLLAAKEGWTNGKERLLADEETLLVDKERLLQSSLNSPPPFVPA